MTTSRDLAIQRARLVKAEAIARVLLDQGATSVQAAALSADARSVAATLAGVSYPSPSTWAVVVWAVQWAEAHQAGLVPNRG